MKENIENAFEIINDDSTLELSLANSGRPNLIIAYLAAYVTSYSNTDDAITEITLKEGNEGFLENVVKTGFNYFGDKEDEVRKKLSKRGIEILDGEGLTVEEQTELDAIVGNPSDQDIAVLKEILGDQWPEE